MQVYTVDVDGWGSSQIQLELAECAARAIFRFFFIRLVQPPDFGDAQIIVKMAKTETPSGVRGAVSRQEVKGV